MDELGYLQEAFAILDQKPVNVRLNALLLYLRKVAKYIRHALFSYMLSQNHHDEMVQHQRVLFLNNKRTL